MAAFLLAACAQYQVQTTGVFGAPPQVDRLAVWSSIGSVTFLGHKHWSMQDSFENHFNAAMKQTLEAEKVAAEVRPLRPRSESPESLAQAEKELKPAARLFIQPRRYRTMQGNVQTLELELSVHEAATNRRLWQGQMQVENNMDATTWYEGGARKLATEIVQALRREGIIRGGG